jgi:hypothetical protein
MRLSIDPPTAGTVSGDGQYKCGETANISTAGHNCCSKFLH